MTRPLSEGEEIVDTHALPRPLFLALDQSSGLYAAETAGIHAHARGSARPLTEETRIGYTGTNACHTKQSIGLVFQDTERKTPHSIGSPLAPQAGQPDARCVRGTSIISSSVPGYKLELTGITEAHEQKVQIYIFANSVMRDPLASDNKGSTVQLFCCLQGDQLWNWNKLDSAI